MIVYAPGCWDLLHVGHVRFLKKASEFGPLFVGVAGDEVVYQDKGWFPTISQDQRLEMVKSLRFVNAAFIYYSLEFQTALSAVDPGILAVGEQWGNYERHHDAEDWMKRHNRRVEIIPYTESVSTTIIKNRIKGRDD